jgi:hypothetical protein
MASTSSIDEDGIEDEIEDETEDGIEDGIEDVIEDEPTLSGSKNLFKHGPIERLCEKFLNSNGVALIGLILLSVGLALVILHDQCEATHCRITKRYQCSTGLSGAVPIKSTRQSCGRRPYYEKSWMCVLEAVPCRVVDKQDVPTGASVSALTASTVLHNRVQGELGHLCEADKAVVAQACFDKWPANTTANVYEYNDFDGVYISKYQLGYMYATDTSQDGHIAVLVLGAIMFPLGLYLWYARANKGSRY